MVQHTISCRTCGTVRSHIVLGTDAVDIGWANVQWTPGRDAAEYLGDCPCRIPRDVPFTLTCIQCDAGTDIESFEHAMEQGWRLIEYTPDLPMANFLGVCPDCRDGFDE